MIGIYVITNNINGKKYVGQSTFIERRWASHKSPYEQNRYPDKPLYKAFNKYGIQNFSFEVLELCDESVLNEREQYWIANLHSLVHEHGYNITTGGDSVCNENHPRHKLTEKDVKDIRIRYKNHERYKEVARMYQDRIGPSGFSKIWKGETWKSIMPEVYTSENKNFHRHNTGQKGSSNGRAKLVEEDIYAIRLRKKNGESQREVYKDYVYTGITPGSFQQIWYGYNWKHVKV